MLKFFLPLFTILIGISYLFSCGDTQVTYSEKCLEPKESVEDTKQIVCQVEKVEIPQLSHKKEIDLKTEIRYLFQEAIESKNQEKYKSALKSYNLIIDKVKNKKEVEFLKEFAKAYFLQAYIYKTHLSDNDEAIKSYNFVIKKFQKSEDIELLKLYHTAQTLKIYLITGYESIEIYNQIIQKFKNSKNVELLQMYASAQRFKSYLVDEDETLEIYNEIIEKFKNTKDKKLLKELSTAQLSKAYLLSEYFEDDQEAIEVYDEFIEKFDQYSSFKQDVSNALFSKSLLVMKDSGEESMEILDHIIERHELSRDTNLPKTVEYAIINNIELSLITSNDDARYRELADKYLSKLEDTKPQLEMLNILKNAQELDQDKEMTQWKKEYKDYKFEDWSFQELREWNSQIEESESKNRIKNYLDEFIKHHTPPPYTKN